MRKGFDGLALLEEPDHATQLSGIEAGEADGGAAARYDDDSTGRTRRSPTIGAAVSPVPIGLRPHADQPSSETINVGGVAILRAIS
jgi:hypothetical protein